MGASHPLCLDRPPAATAGRVDTAPPLTLVGPAPAVGSSTAPATDACEVLAVGFADMVGFTSLGEEIGPNDLTRLVRCFQHTAAEVIRAHRGRIVKFHGDEAMFVADELGDAVDIALGLVEHLAVAAVPATLHCGVARGPVVDLDGDVFGRTVNLASRITGAAAAGAVWLPRADADDLAHRPDLRVRPVRRSAVLEGLGPMPMVEVSRRARRC